MLEEYAGVLPEFAFRDGKLHIRSGDVEMRIRGGAEPAAQFRRGNEGWQEFLPEFRLVKPPEQPDGGHAGGLAGTRAGAASLQQAGPSGTDKKQRAFCDFRASLAPRTAAAVERFQSHQWNLIDLLCRAEQAHDLAENNPALAWCLANNDHFKRTWAVTPAAYAQPIVGRKQRDILDWLGFPCTEAMVHLMRKIPPEAVTPLDARFLRRAIKAEADVSRSLAHVRVINAGVLGLVCNLRLLPAISPQLLAEVSESPEEMIDQCTADLLINAMYLLLRGHIRWNVPRFTARRPVQEFHDRIVTEWVRREDEARQLLLAKARREQAARRPVVDQPKKKPIPEPREFPPPPIPGTDTIIPLTTKQELLTEGEEQRNCVGGYAPKVKSGGVYIYKVLSPERATLEITLRADGSWRRAELKAKDNGPISRNTRDEIDRWLGRFSLSV